MAMLHHEKSSCRNARITNSNSMHRLLATARCHIRQICGVVTYEQLLAHTFLIFAVAVVLPAVTRRGCLLVLLVFHIHIIIKPGPEDPYSSCGNLNTNVRM